MTSATAPTGQLDAAAAFAKYDRSGAGYVTVEGMRALLKDVGLLEGRGAADATAFVVQQFALASRKSRDDRLSFDEFSKFYAKVTAPKLLDALSAELPAEVAQLRTVFAAFASFGAARSTSTAPTAEMDGARFVKLCKETGLVGKGLTTTDCDLMFAKAKERTARRVSFEQFLDVLGMVAAKKGQPLEAVVRQVAAAGGPAQNGTTATEAVRFHDDLSTYTGVAARRSSIGTEGTPAASAAARRRSAGTPSSSAGSALRSARSGSLGGARGSQLSARRCSVGGAEGATTPDVQSRDSLREAFTAFASFGLGSSPLPSKGGAEMNSKQFVKCMRDAGIIDRKLTATSCDLAFVAKAKPLGARKISYRQFQEAVAQLAAEKGVAKEELFAQIASCGGPSLNQVVTPEAICSESGRLLARSPATEAAAAAAWTAAAAEAAAVQGNGGVVEEEVESGIAAGISKLDLGGKVVNISAVAASPQNA